MLIQRSLGWRTFASELRCALAASEAAEVVHVDLDAEGLQRVLGARLPREPSVVSNQVRKAVLWRQHARVLSSTLVRGRFDFVLASPSVLGPLVVAACRQTSTPFALSIDATLSLYGEFKAAPAGWGAGQRRLDAFDRATFRQAALIAPMSDWAARSLRDDYGIAEQWIHVTPPSVQVDVMPIRPPRRSVDRRLRVVWLGNEWERKGGADLVRWHQTALRDHVELHLIGSAPNIAADGVYVHGRVPRDQIASLLPSMDVMALPSHFDLSPFVLAEAAAAGLPAVASSIGAIAELVRDGETGVLCEPGDGAGFVAALRGLAADPDRVDQLGAAARRHAQKRLNARRTYPALVDAILRTARSRPSRP